MIKAKRFWKEVSVKQTKTGYQVNLDNRELLTPLKNPLKIPTQQLANEIAREWQEVESEIIPENMPFTKRANSAIEYIGTQREGVEADLSSYVNSDLICYRAEGPTDLVALQLQWDQWIAWVQRFGIDLKVTAGVMPIQQPVKNEENALKWLRKWNDFQLSAIYDFITLTGSFAIGAAIAENAVTPQKGYELSTLDEVFQEQIWGADEDARESRIKVKLSLNSAFAYFKLL